MISQHVHHKHKETRIKDDKIRLIFVAKLKVNGILQIKR